MVTLVVILNFLIMLLGWYAAWRIWCWRSALATAADALILAERATHRVLHQAPQAILKGQLGSYQLQQRYRRLELQLQMVQQILGLIGVGQMVWRYYQQNQRRRGGPQRREHQPESFGHLSHSNRNRNQRS